MFYLHKLCVASKQIFVVVVVVVVVVSAAAVNFVFDSVQKLLNIPSYVHTHTHTHTHTSIKKIHSAKSQGKDMKLIFIHCI
jgi:hypothetical protein